MDSDDEDLLAELLDESKPRQGGSRPGRRKSKPRQRYKGYCILYFDYFAELST